MISEISFILAEESESKAVANPRRTKKCYKQNRGVSKLSLKYIHAQKSNSGKEVAVIRKDENAELTAQKLDMEENEPDLLGNKSEERSSMNRQSLKEIQNLSCSEESAKIHQMNLSFQSGKGKQSFDRSQHSTGQKTRVNGDPLRSPDVNANDKGMLEGSDDDSFISLYLSSTIKTKQGNCSTRKLSYYEKEDSFFLASSQKSAPKSQSSSGSSKQTENMNNMKVESGFKSPPNESLIKTIKKKQVYISAPIDRTAKYDGSNSYAATKVSTLHDSHVKCKLSFVDDSNEEDDNEVLDNKPEEAPSRDSKRDTQSIGVRSLHHGEANFSQTQKQKFLQMLDSSDDETSLLPLANRVSPPHPKATHSNSGKSVGSVKKDKWGSLADCVSAEESDQSLSSTDDDQASGDKWRHKSFDSRRGITLLNPTNSYKTPKVQTNTNDWNHQWRSEPPAHYRTKPKQHEKRKCDVHPKKAATFLASLMERVPRDQCDPEALVYRDNFKKKKDMLVEKLYKLFNEKAFDKKLPETMKITWNPRLTATAGLCYCSQNVLNREQQYQGRMVRIELSTKVITSAERLRDTLIHEMCHAASWLINGYRKGHGALWKCWAVTANVRFPELPLIKRCHSYLVETKYTYQCTICGQCIGRHSKSIDVDKKVCGRCGGKLELLVGNKGSASTPSSLRTPSKFAMFVKENYGSVKKASGAKTHGDVMKALSREFAQKAKIADNNADAAEPRQEL